MDRFDKLVNILIEYEKDGLLEYEIMDCFETYLKENNDIDLYYDVNDVLFNAGYHIQFVCPKWNTTKFTSEEYEKKIVKVKQSYPKTIEFMKYLNSVSHLSLSVIGMDFILVKHLFQAKLMSKDEIECDENMTLMDLYFANYEDDDVRKYIEERVFGYIGIEYLDIEYTRFHLDMEYLLYCIKLVDTSKKNYYKINTIKVALNIIDEKYVMWNKSAYYDKQIHKKILKYIDLIPKELRKKYVKKHIDELKYYYADGYKVLFNLL